MVLFLRARMGIASAENRLEKSPQEPRCQPSSGSAESVWPHLLLEFVCLSETAFYLSEVRKTSGAEKTGPEEDEINGEQPADFLKKQARQERVCFFVSCAPE